MISLSGVTIPTPEPYSKTDSTRNQENLDYVILQILSLAKAADDQDYFGLLASIGDARTAISLDLDDLSIRTYGSAAIVESP